MMIFYDNVNQLSQFQIQNVGFQNSILSKLSKREWKIVGIALIVFAFLGLALYQLYRWSHKVSTEKKEDLPITNKDIQQVSQKIGIEKKSSTDQVIVAEPPPLIVSNPPVIVQETPPGPALPYTIPIEETPSDQVVQEKKIPNFGSSKIILTPPAVDMESLYKELSLTSPAINALPHSYLSCQFVDIRCPKETHVKIDGQTPQVYLHANDVKFDQHHYIATQYPKQKPLFWLASKECSLIVDLTNGADMTKGLVSYAPQVGDSAQYGEVIVDCQEIIHGTESSFNTYTYQIQKGSEVESSSTVSRLHYTGWPDHHGIAKEDLDRLTEIIKCYQAKSEKPILVHCRAGVGRTGTIIVACEMKKLIKAGSITQDNLLPTLKSLILEGRKQRGPYFVQTSSQLQALWEWSWWALERQMNLT